jgi:sulfur-oxidizing protein SoxX
MAIKKFKGAGLALVLAGLTAGAAVISSAALAGSEEAIEAGKAAAFDRGKGNCLACHQIEGGESPGNIGPPLLAMKVRYPERAKLKAQIWDATVLNPESAMPPFGKHGLLSEEELEHVVDFIWTL